MTFNEKLKRLKNYEPGKDMSAIMAEYGLKRVIKLASNENPLGPSPLALAALREGLGTVHLYPDDAMRQLRGALGEKFGVDPGQIIIGAGSDQIIEYAMRAKLGPREAFLQAGVSFAMYEIYGDQIGARCYKTPSLGHELREFKRIFIARSEEIKLIFLCLPNNPLGECVAAAAVEDFVGFIQEASGGECLVVIDAAYNEFAAHRDEAMRLDPAKLTRKFQNLLYLGTFSKLYALGGLRVGYGISSPEIIAALQKLRAPFNVNSLALLAAAAALGDEDFIRASLENNARQMELYEDFAKKHEIKYIPSYTNFISYFLDKNGTEASNIFAEKLLKAGIIVRNLRSYGLNALRITVGLPEENELFFAEFEKILRG